MKKHIIFSVLLISFLNLFLSECRRDPPVHKDWPGWKYFNSANAPLDKYGVENIIVDRLSNEWVFTGGYIAKYSDGEWQKIDPPALEPDAFLIYAKGVSMGNYIWFGNANHGLYRINIFDNSIQLFDQSNSGIIASVTGTEIAADTLNSVLWISTAAGMVRYDGTNWQVYDMANSPVTSDQFDGVGIDNSGNKWFSAKENPSVSGDSTSYIKYNEITGQWSIYNTATCGFNVYHAWDIVADDDNGIWFSNEYADRYYQGSWTRYSSTNVQGFPNDLTKWMIKDRKGRIWITSSQNGVMVFDHGSWSHLTSQNSGLLTDTINSIAIMKNGEIWVGTNEGISVYDNQE
ncbi:MAG: hypothetical protein HY064_11070 [Bacteroidetes bacterium]|nr:hypothetical protein [Bacteroidota bacterium]